MARVVAGVPNVNLLSLIPDGLFTDGPPPPTEYEARLLTTFPGYNASATYADLVEPNGDQYAPKSCVPFSPHKLKISWAVALWTTVRADGAFSGKLTWAYLSPVSYDQHIRGWALTTRESSPRLLMHGPIDPPIRYGTFGDRVDLVCRIISTAPEQADNIFAGGLAGGTAFLARKAADVLRDISIVATNPTFPAFTSLHAFVLPPDQYPDAHDPDGAQVRIKALDVPAVRLSLDRPYAPVTGGVRLTFRRAGRPTDEPAQITFRPTRELDSPIIPEIICVCGSPRRLFKDYALWFVSPDEVRPLRTPEDSVTATIKLDVSLAGFPA